MNKYQIHLKDIGRILFGQAPPLFLVEVFFRALITYTLLLLIVRWLGKRMTGELTIMEMAVMVTLGAIVATPMQVPERGILLGLVLLLCAVAFQRGISYLGYRSHKFENITQGKPSLMVRDGIMQIENMRTDRISKNQLLAALRQQGITNLGLVERVYLEACGLFSIYLFSGERPGLATYPGDDVFNDPQQIGVQQLPQILVCHHCGNLPGTPHPLKCSNCGKHDFIMAVE
ncbi:hypothetical protein CKK33_02395 [Mucilaginibacter sp. MD40]|uniref:DUF421 domain-containing protein n=1 Tax=Mucilaginibacter sp. MD40 TaxID=2029590 RepID=UPI000BAC8807|nr:YetF domain-containing protein [Mucilaginibacter sp. MD40]PAW92404.1 hypothetical protein CKK33_02395 [Mucilaginibacter sp. MD40]